MITIETVCVEVRGVRPDELLRWIDEAWVRPQGAPGAWEFTEIDMARVRLIVDLREHLRIGEDAMPVVLSLVDQLYEERRRMRRVRDVLDRSVSGETRAEILRLLGAA